MDMLGPKFPNVAQEGGKLFVRSKHQDFSEDLIEIDGESWRPWDARRSKVGAAIVKRVSQLGIKEGDTVLYLGAAHGYTATFIADIVTERGTVFCLDFSANVVRALLRKSRGRTNMIPILGDASKLDEYSWRVSGVDVVIMDIAQRDQTGIFLRACERFLKPGGFGILALKARSVDMAREPREVFRDSYRALEAKVRVVDYRELSPFEKDHAVFIIKQEAPVAGQASGFPERAPDAGFRGERGSDRGGRSGAPRQWQPRQQQREWQPRQEQSREPYREQRQYGDRPAYSNQGRSQNDSRGQGGQWQPRDSYQNTGRDGYADRAPSRDGYNNRQGRDGYADRASDGRAPYDNRNQDRAPQSDPRDANRQGARPRWGARR